MTKEKAKAKARKARRAIKEAKAKEKAKREKEKEKAKAKAKATNGTTNIKEGKVNLIHGVVPSRIKTITTGTTIGNHGNQQEVGHPTTAPHPIDKAEAVNQSAPEIIGYQR